MRTPGPDHPITIARNPHRLRITANGRVLGETDGALTLSEASYPPVQYIPRKDIDMAALTRTDRTTHCPYKGDASYYTISAPGGELANAVWTYETPFSAVADIAGHLAFYPDKVRIEQL